MKPVKLHTDSHPSCCKVLAWWSSFVLLQLTAGLTGLLNTAPGPAVVLFGVTLGVAVFLVLPELVHGLWSVASCLATPAHILGAGVSSSTGYPGLSEASGFQEQERASIAT